MEAVRFIREHAHLPLSVDDVLREITLSRRPLERRFRKCFGHGVADEIRRSHIERSQQLLMKNELSIEAVAQRSGFSGARHLAAVFRREVGMTPSDFQKRSRLQ